MKLHIGLVLLLSLAPLPVRAQMFVLSTVSAHSQPSTAMNAKDVPRNSGLWGVEVAQLVPSASQEDAKESVVVVVKIAKHSPARHALSQGELIRWVGAGGSANGRVTNPAEFYMYASQCVRDCILQVSSGSGTTFIAGFRSVGKLGMNYLPNMTRKRKRWTATLTPRRDEATTPRQRLAIM